MTIRRSLGWPVNAACALFMCGGLAHAQQAPLPAPPPQVDFAKITVHTTNLGHNMYMLDGVGGKIGRAHV